MHNDTNARDARKCLMPDPERCGRSPKTITKERILGLDIEQTGDLFGRKVMGVDCSLLLSCMISEKSNSYPSLFAD